MLVILYPIFAFVLLQIAKRYRRQTALIRPVLYIMFFMCLFCPVFYSHHDFKHSTHAGVVTLEPLLYWFFMYLILMFPLWGVDVKNLFVKKVDVRKLQVLSFFLIIISLITSLLYLPYATTFNVGQFEDQKEQYQTGLLIITNNAILKSVMNMHSTFRSIISFQFFYYLAFVVGYKKTKILLGISAIFPIILMTFAKSVRADTAFLAIQLFVLYMLFYPYLNERLSDKIKQIGLVFAGFVVFLMISFSIFRFSSGNWDWDPLFYIYSYISESILNFNTLLYHHLNIITYGDMNFPVIRSYLGLDYSADAAEYKFHYLNKLHFISWYFYSIIGEFMRDFGHIGSAVFFILFAILIKIIFKNYTKCNTISYVQLFIVFLYIDFLSTGLFYNKYSGFWGNLTIQNLLIFSFLISMYLKNKKQ